MTGGQVAALILAILLLLPGGCFLVIGVAFLVGGDSGAADALSIAIPILAVMTLLFWVAFRKRRPPSPGARTTSP